MKKTILFVAAGVMFATGASAAPLLNQGSAISQPTTLENVRLVCREDGRCYRTGGRRYVELSWSRLSEQNLRVDKWSICQG